MEDCLLFFESCDATTSERNCDRQKLFSTLSHKSDTVKLPLITDPQSRWKLYKLIGNGSP